MTGRAPPRPRAVAAALAYVLLLPGPDPAAASDRITIRVEAAEKNKAHGGFWDTGAGALLFRPLDILPDMRICLDGACAPVCTDSRECTAEFPRPARDVATLRVVDADDTNADDPILQIDARAEANCTPCTVGDGAYQSRIWISNWQPRPRCIPADEAVRKPEYKTLAEALGMIRRYGRSSRTDMANFKRSGGAVMVCPLRRMGAEMRNQKAFYAPSTHNIVLAGDFVRTTSRDEMLRTLFEEFAHGTDAVPAGLDPGDPSALPASAERRWVEGYRDSTAHLEAQGWINAFLESRRFKRLGVANPPMIPWSGMAPRRAETVRMLIEAVERGEETPDRATELLVYEVLRAPSMIGDRPVTYRELFTHHGQNIWACGRSGAVEQGTTRLWACGR